MFPVIQKHATMNQSLFKTLLIALCSLFLTRKAFAQLPQCDKVYISLSIGIGVSDTLMTYDPILPVSAANPSINSILMPQDNVGLAISPVLGSGNTTLTYYTTSGGTYWYYDPTTSVWVNTGHSIGQSTNVNIAAGGGYIYSMRGFGNSPGVYRYDGTGNAVWITTVVAPLPYDLVADCEGNFYVISNIGPAWSMTKYNSGGSMVAGYTVNNPNLYFLSGGLARIGDKFYADDATSKGLAIGDFNGSTLNLNTLTAPVPILQAGFRVNDMATCAGGFTSLPTVTISPADTTLCASGPVTLTANASAANGQYQWYVNGSAVTGATGATFTYTPTGNSTVKVDMLVSDACSNVTVTSPEAHLSIAETEDISIHAPASVCAGDTVSISAEGSSNNSYSWDFGGGSVQSGAGSGPYRVHWSTSGNTTVRVHAGSGACSAQDSTIIKVQARPAVEAVLSSPVLCIGDTITVKVNTDVTNNVTWLPGKNNTLLSEQNREAKFLIAGNGTITVQAENQSGCISSAVIPLTPDNCCRLMLPNAFSPNGDQLNDFFGPVRNGQINIKALNIYNRWGQLVYFHGGKQAGWDGTYQGTPLDPGTYFYSIRYSCGDDATIFEKKGDLTLVR